MVRKSSYPVNKNSGKYRDFYLFEHYFRLPLTIAPQLVQDHHAAGGQNIRVNTDKLPLDKSYIQLTN